MGQTPALSNTMPVVSATAGHPQTEDPLWLALVMAVVGQQRTPAVHTDREKLLNQPGNLSPADLNGRFIEY